jgi:hypothetical protein
MVSKIKVDEIESSQSGGTIQYNSSLKLKQLTTAQIDALTGMTSGEMVYDSDVNTIKCFDGTDWQVLFKSTLFLSALVVGGGGAAGGGVSGQWYGSGAAGGLLRVQSQSAGVSGGNYTVTVGAGGATAGSQGNTSTFNTTNAAGGGGTTSSRTGANNSDYSGSYYASGTKAGAGAGAGGNASNDDGGIGAINNDFVNATQAGTYSIGEVSGSDVYWGGGGGGGDNGTGGLGGGANGTGGGSGSPGTDNTGGGGGGAASSVGNNSNGGSGIVIIKYSKQYDISIGAGLFAANEFESGDYKYRIFTAGTGTVSFV